MRLARGLRDGRVAVVGAQPAERRDDACGGRLVGAPAATADDAAGGKAGRAARERREGGAQGVVAHGTRCLRLLGGGKCPRRCRGSGGARVGLGGAHDACGHAKRLVGAAEGLGVVRRQQLERRGQALDRSRQGDGAARAPSATGAVAREDDAQARAQQAVRGGHVVGGGGGGGDDAAGRRRGWQAWRGRARGRRRRKAKARRRRRRLRSRRRAAPAAAGRRERRRGRRPPPPAAVAQHHALRGQAGARRARAHGRAAAPSAATTAAAAAAAASSCRPAPQHGRLVPSEKVGQLQRDGVRGREAARPRGLRVQVDGRARERAGREEGGGGGEGVIRVGGAAWAHLEAVPSRQHVERRGLELRRRAARARDEQAARRLARGRERGERGQGRRW